MMICFGMAPRCSRPSNLIGLQHGRGIERVGDQRRARVADLDRHPGLRVC
jgi:hypothetical protein